MESSIDFQRKSLLARRGRRGSMERKSDRNVFEKCGRSVGKLQFCPERIQGRLAHECAAPSHHVRNATEPRARGIDRRDSSNRKRRFRVSHQQPSRYWLDARIRESQSEINANNTV